MSKIIIDIASALIVVVAFIAAPARAEIVGVESSVVTRYSAYGDFGNGDVIFVISPRLTGCVGGWIASTQPGAKNLIATVISAKLSGRAVVLAV